MKTIQLLKVCGKCLCNSCLNKMCKESICFVCEMSYPLEKCEGYKGDKKE